MSSAAIDLQASRDRRDAGIDRSARNSGQEWQDDAYLSLVRFLDLRMSSVLDAFLCEEVRDAAERAGLPDPPTKRAWGAVMRRAARNRLIVRQGYAPALSSNLSPKVLWRRA